MATTKTELHVVMLPWCAFGHIIPFFQLSVSLARAGVSVSFVATPRNINRLPKIPPNLETLVNLVELPMPFLENQLLPPEAEATVDLPGYDAMPYLKVAYDQLQEPFRQYVAASKPDWIIADLIPHWAAEVAGELEVPLLIFSIFPTCALLFLGPPEYLVGEGQRRLRGSPETLTRPPEWVDFPTTVAFRRFEADGLYAGLFGENDSGVSDAARVAKILGACRGVSIRSCYELEGRELNLYRKVLNRDVIPVGLLPREDTTTGLRTEDVSKIFTWLDEQKDKTVMFVGFGSEVKLTKEQVFEIARGLEVSSVTFLWALRRPSWATNDFDAVPSGFSTRVAGRGVVFTGWAPQMEILAHPAIGGSLIQSGWGSVIETLQFGHCLVVLPFIFDQGLIARFLVEKGLAVEVERSEDGSFTGEGIAKSMRLAMVEEEGEAMRVRAREAISVFGDKKLHQEHYITKFVEYLKNGIVIPN